MLDFIRGTSIDNVLFLFLGWLLGLLAPVISDSIKKRRDTGQVKKALLAELHELQFRVAMAGYYAQMRFGQIDKAYLQWLLTIAKAYRGRNPKEAIIQSIEMQLALTDEQLRALVQTGRASSEGGLSLKKYLVPLLDSHVASLWFFETDFQKQLLEIRTQLGLLNEEVDQGRYYFGLTFSDLGGENHERVNSNLADSYRHFASRARTVATRIGELGHK